MLQSVRVQRFKSISDATISLGNVTLLVGPNNAGKSSLLHAIQFAVSVAQSLRLDNVSLWDGDNLSGSLSAQQLVYTPLRDVHALAPGGKLRQDANQAIEVLLTTSDLSSSTIQVRRGRNKNIAVNIQGSQLGSRLEQMEHPYSVVAPGLAGIPAYEEYRSPGIVQRAAAKGDANGVFRNILWLLKQDTPAWQQFQTRLGTIFSGLEIDVVFDASVDEVISAIVIKEDGNLPIDSCGTGVLQAIQTLAYIGVYKPQLLILDEPDSHLHPDNQRRLARLLSELSSTTQMQVIISTHSRHFLDEFSKLDAIIHWFSGGQPHPENSDRVSVLLGLGALDAGDKLRNGNTPLVVLTEDSLMGNLKKVLQSSGLGDDICDVWSYAGCSNVQSAKVLGNFIREHAPGTRVLVHRDRDYMSDESAAQYAQDLHAAGLDVFLTTGTDVESHLLSAEHLFEIAPEITRDQLEELIIEATEEAREKSVEKCINHRMMEAQRARNRGGSEPNAGRIAAESNRDYLANPSRYRYGKGVLGLVKSKIQQRLGRNIELSQASAGLSVEQLRRIATEINPPA
ncbi:AAA ATPase-like protein [Pseudomonas sp. 478]|uniref:AAA family ATPase n=1 Tax=unclassified Pseudomonas TaxID=196821 RepID=UPI000DAB79E5|nr:MULTISPECIES: ATP-binding protein [unclassified Pseudomonas]PZW97299.1 AAA ATPase-like protein [Pseudomonas sp. 478]TCV54800.1 AAA ATPase-like protein [Pseudomonas sp. 460]